MALQARAILESDGNMNNNAGEIIMVKPVVSGFPAVTDLSGSIDATANRPCNGASQNTMISLCLLP